MHDFLLTCKRNYDLRFPIFLVHDWHMNRRSPFKVPHHLVGLEYHFPDEHQPVIPAYLPSDLIEMFDLACSHAVEHMLFVRLVTSRAFE